MLIQDSGLTALSQPIDCVCQLEDNDLIGRNLELVVGEHVVRVPRSLEVFQIQWGSNFIEGQI